MSLGCGLAVLRLPFVLRERVAMTTVIVALMLGGVVGALVAAALLQRRQQRQMVALAGRLESLEARWLAEDDAPGAAAGAPQGIPPAAQADDTVTPTGDVLAGLTTHVQRLLVSGRGSPECLADQAILVIFKNLTVNLAPAQMAAALDISLRTLERGLALALDCTPSQLIVAVKMREARRLLSDGEMRVADVAERLGFANPFHFSRRFKAFYGVAPSESRTVLSGGRRSAAAGRSLPH
jgi:AraC-like DNA-binding protein/surface antigen